jgi:glucokinase-like ROK family protein
MIMKGDKMTVTGNSQFVKQMNKSIVLEMIKSSSPLSRAEISQHTGLNKGTVSALVSELLKENLIDERGPGKSSGGRRPVMLLFNQYAGFSIGIDLGVNYIFGVLTDLQGKIVQEQHISLNDKNYESVYKKLIEMINSLIKEAPPSPFGIIGIGVAVPGIVNTEEKILLAPNLGWKNIDLKKKLEEKFSIPIVIENEGNASVYAEKHFGAGKGIDELVYISAGIGIGVGLMIKGELSKGLNGFSGELGHMIIEANGKLCRCGSRGCWEMYASEQSLIDSAKESSIISARNTLELNKDINLATLLSFAEQNNTEVIELLQQIGTYIGIGINNIINTFNPERIVIGNRLAKAEKWLREPIKTTIQEKALYFNQIDCTIEFSKLSIYAAALGVSAFTVKNFLRVSENKTETIHLQY